MTTDKLQDFFEGVSSELLHGTLTSEELGKIASAMSRGKIRFSKTNFIHCVNWVSDLKLSALLYDELMDGELDITGRDKKSGEITFSWAKAEK